MKDTKTFLSNFLSFFIKVVILHTATYILSSMLFSNILDYSTLFSIPDVANFMRDYNSRLVLMAPFFQPIRALFIAIALYPFIDRLKSSKLGALMIFSIFAFIGILATPSPAPGSIEGLIYTTTPIKFQLMILPELFFQTFLFSLLLWISISLPFESKNELSLFLFLPRFLKSIIVSICGAILFSLSGILNLQLNGIDTDINIKLVDKSELSILGSMAFLNTVFSYILGPIASKKRLIQLILVIIYFAIYVGIPYLYNKSLDLTYENLINIILTFVVALLVSLISFILFKSYKKDKEPSTEELKKIEYKNACDENAVNSNENDDSNDNINKDGDYTA